MSRRLQELRKELSARSLNGFLVTDILNVRYLSGFTGSYAVLLVTGDTAFLLTDSRYAEQAGEECPNAVLELVRDGWAAVAGRLVERFNLRRVGFEGHALHFRDWQELQSNLGPRELTAEEDVVGYLRLVKDRSELSAIRGATRIADLACEYVCGIVKPGVAERDVALRVECFMRENGAEKEAFESIVASGPRSALPHAKPTGRQISERELVVLDFGARYNGYHSDITRTVLLGTPDEKQLEVYNVVLEAQSKAIDAIRPGALGCDIDGIAREHIASKGYGEYFGHGLGHGLGLAVHEGSILREQSDIVLQSGMVVTVEPGIYIPGWGGVRLEDDVLVADTGAEILTKSPKVLALK